MTKEKISGIYCIENLVNGKKYIGQSCDIYSRWYNHKYCLNNNKHENDYLQKSWNKYGEKNFTFTIIEKCSTDEIDNKEIFYIIELKTMLDINGYNLDSGGNKNKRHSEETKMKISKSAKGRIVSEETRLKISINRKCKMCGDNHPNFGKKLSEDRKYQLYLYAKSRFGDKCYQSRKVICVNTNEIFSTIKEASDKYKHLKVNDVNIGKCCRGERRYCGRFENGDPIQWEYYKHDKIYTKKSNLDEYIGNSKPIIQYDLNGNFIAEYESARECEKKTGIGYKMISRVCNGGRPHTHGYIFKFKE